MSYILDALKKSEQERGHGNVPGVQTIHSSSLLYRNEKKSFWPYLLIIAVLLNFAIISFYIYTQRTKAQQNNKHNSNAVLMKPEVKLKQASSLTQIKAQQTSLIRTDNKITNKKEIRTAARLEPINQPSIIQKQNKQTDSVKSDFADKHTDKKSFAKNLSNKPSVASASINLPVHQIKTRPEIIEQSDLPAAIKRELPTIVITSHVYSDNPQQRSMVINNEFLEEGDYIIDDLKLYKITPDGAIFSYKGLLFHNGIVSSWQ